MSTRRWFDGQYYWDMRPLAVVRAIAPLRRGPQGRLRATVRCALLRIIGYASCDEIPLDAVIPHRFPRESGLTPQEVYELVLVAQDGLNELGYGAAADELRDDRRGMGYAYRAKDALDLLEGGLPSVTVGAGTRTYAILTQTIKRLKGPPRADGSRANYIIGRAADDPRWWYRFAEGVPVHSTRGEWVGWDVEGGWTFQRRGRTLEDVKAAQYGSDAIG